MSVSRARQRPSDAVELTLAGALAIGFFALTGAILLARGAPATGYELSIYAGTPMFVWVGVGIAMVVALICTFLSPPGPVRRAALFLGGGGIITVVALPLLRGYWYVGVGDSLSHLGWARSVVDNVVDPASLFYPSIHTAATALSIVTGSPLNRTLLLVVVCAIAVFLLLIPLVVRELAGDDRAFVLAAVSAWLLLPVNHVAVHMTPHPSTQAIFVSAVPIFALILYLSRADAASRSLFSSYGALLFVTAGALVLFHPMQALNLFMVFGTVWIVQIVARLRNADSTIGSHPPMGAQTFALGSFLAAWMVSRERFQRAVVGVLADVFIPGGGSGTQVSQRGVSLTELGGGIEVLFSKLFLVGALYFALAALAVLWAWFGSADDSTETRALVTYLGLSFVPLSALFVAYYAGSPTLAFRQLGFLSVLATILGVIGFWWLLGGLRRLTSSGAANTVAVVVLVCLLALSLVIVFPSPYIYKTTQHVSEQEMAGYQTAFDHRAGDTGFAGVSGAADRYADATYGFNSDRTLAGPSPSTDIVTPENFSNHSVASQYDSDRYFVVAESDVQREATLYKERSYSVSGFQSLDEQRRLNKVQSNDEFSLYRVDAERNR
ncbi:hypothetical protein [Halegenticoccus tardaugens]|uniref:hypothetical protein n=1 Tax=Halegenticoccus tardaugens TaxID=2071624 RepID=UPI00100B6758|nr:hypothetical protein [Halegenticoccus tardaugens]